MRQQALKEHEDCAWNMSVLDPTVNMTYVVPGLLKLSLRFFCR